MLQIAIPLVLLLYAGWAWLLYRLHVALDAIDPVMSEQIGQPSLFWTPFNGHALLVGLIRRRDLRSTRHAPLATQARVMRAWAVATVAGTVWLLWVVHQTPGF
ncbi:MAG TPA: hypothetical protein PKA16_04555 [Ottowia sp.]|uniref:hypothetical protein n=1 Tax=Ottowia sp. TaxID=1898956 RepID=UPI002C12440C|nr:hypothetical protein [Ottowia sp.]HMN20646.1 hypothetical protein [Ottowia sp.]